MTARQSALVSFAVASLSLSLSLSAQFEDPNGVLLPRSLHSKEILWVRPGELIVQPQVKTVLYKYGLHTEV